MSTYDISGLDWQTAHNNSTAAPSYRESDGMTKVADSFYEGQIHSVDAVFCEGYLRGLNHALRMLGLEIIPLEHLVPRCAVTAHEFQRALRHLIRENHVPGGACKVGVCLDVFVCHCCSLPFFTRTVEAAPRLFPCIIHLAHPVKGSIIHSVHSRRVDLRLMCFKFLRISATF